MEGIRWRRLLGCGHVVSCFVGHWVFVVVYGYGLVVWLMRDWAGYRFDFVLLVTGFGCIGDVGLRYLWMVVG